MKLSGTTAAFLFAVTLIVAPWTARAETIFLQCSRSTYTVDLTKNTVDNIPATITATAISWELHKTYDDGTTYAGQVNLDRTTGVLTQSGTLCFGAGGSKGTCQPGPSSEPQTCVKANPPPTKF